MPHPFYRSLETQMELGIEVGTREGRSIRGLLSSLLQLLEIFD
jgi:hypothetical protein